MMVMMMTTTVNDDCGYGDDDYRDHDDGAGVDAGVIIMMLIVCWNAMAVGMVMVASKADNFPLYGSLCL